MDVTEEDLVGEPLSKVPQQQPSDQDCLARRHEKRDGETVFVGYCRSWPGRGTDHVGEGRCTNHGGDGGSGGEREGAGAGEGNDNAATHELYSEENAYYQRRGEGQQSLIDDIYSDYHDRFRTRNGEPATGDEAMLFKVAVSIHKLLMADDWIEDRPPELDSGHPLIDRSEKRTAQGEPYYEYVRSAVMQAEKQLEGFVRRWLKDNDLLGPSDDGADVEVSLTGQMWDNLTDYYED